jgi:hypothetical protein
MVHLAGWFQNKIVTTELPRGLSSGRLTRSLNYKGATPKRDRGL